MSETATSKAHILVVDDSYEILDFVQNSVLAAAQYQVSVAIDGKQGFELAMAERPDLILLDYEMPRMNGIEVLQALNEQQIRIPVILITSYGSESVAVDVFRLGVRDYVPKPFAVVEILEAIRRVLRESRLEQERDALFIKLQLTNTQLARRVKELDTLYHISKSVTTLQERDKLMERIVDAALFLTGALDGLLVLLDPVTGNITTQVQREHRGRGYCTPTGESRNIYTQSMSLLINVPLQIGRKVVGSLTVSSKRNRVPLNQEDKRLLRMLADYAAIAIENFRLVAKIEKQQEQEKRDLQDRFAHYLSPPIVKRIMEQPTNIRPGGQRQTIAVLFADLRGFTRFSGYASPEGLIAVLNRHIALATEMILEDEGTLDKFMGDEVMAFFNAPLPQQNYAWHAVHAAWCIQQATQTLHQELPVHQRLRFGIGIATGDAVVGNVGSYNIVNYTAVGPTVGKAHTLQELAQAGKILICQNTYERVNRNIQAKALPPTPIKGQTHPEPVYEVQAIKQHDPTTLQITYQER